jgi:carbon monoxide dehydrogenase subunit G
MEFNGTFELEDTTREDVWLALSDPVLVQSALPGCEFLVRVDDGDVDFDALAEEHGDDDRELTGDPDVIEARAFEEGARYAALVQLSVGPVNPSFETVVTIEHREFPEMQASGEGSSGDSSFEMSSGMELSATDDGVAVDWETQADVFGRVAQMGQRVVNPVANRVVKRFFSSVQEELRDLQLADAEGDSEGESSGKRSLTDRLLGRSGDKE